MKRLKTENSATALCISSVILTTLLLLPPHINSASISRSEATRNARRHGRTSRPSSTDSGFPLKPSLLVMVPLDLQESVDSKLDPDVDSLDPFHMLDIMGPDYDSRFMSLRQPSDMKTNPNGTLMYQFNKEQTPKGQMPDEIAALSAKTIKLSEDGLELRVKFSRKTKRKIQKFLWSYSYCPVRYKWKELSIRFWPRWIKVGQCENKRSCSIPAGMTCQPSRLQNIKLLRYYCPFSGSCDWIKIEYPILAQCSCGCQQHSDSEYRT